MYDTRRAAEFNCAWWKGVERVKVWAAASIDGPSDDCHFCCRQGRRVPATRTCLTRPRRLMSPPRSGKLAELTSAVCPFSIIASTKELARYQTYLHLLQPHPRRGCITFCFPSFRFTPHPFQRTLNTKADHSTEEECAQVSRLTTLRLRPGVRNRTISLEISTNLGLGVRSLKLASDSLRRGRMPSRSACHL